jgi:hypothetical protein
MKALPLAAALLLAACATPESGTGSAGATADPNAGSGVEGLAIRFFRCDDNAFTVQNYRGRSVRVTTGDGTHYDLQPRDGAYTDGAVTYARQGNSATLTGAAGGPYNNCMAPEPS